MNKKEKIVINVREKKRIKTHLARPDISSIVPVNVDCFRLEEQESAVGCYENFLKSCDKIREHFQVIVSSKKGNEKEVTLSQLKPHVALLIMGLKKLNRLDKHQWKKSRDAVNEKKQKVDVLHLRYQNLLYEATHIQKEVTKCLEFKSKDEEIELVSLEEFYRDAPESISNPAVTKIDDHELTLARLSWESEQRKIFAAKLKEAEIIKQNYIESNKKLQENLSNVLPTLRSIVKAAAPFQSKTGMPFQIIPFKHKPAKYLPRPLYTLYVNASAYEEYCGGKTIHISMEGNIDDVKALRTKSDELSEESGESDREESTEMDTHRRTDSSKKEKICKDILMKHPMSVLVIIDKELKIVLEFKYLIYLHIVTVTVKSLSPEPMTTDLVGNLLRLDTFLNCLLPSDTGRESPNIINQLQSKFGFNEPPFKNETTGWPYSWAQRIAGIEVMSDSLVEGVKPIWHKQIPLNIAKTIDAICSRLVARNQLYHQILSLEQRISVSPQFAALYPLNISTQLKKWSPVSWKAILDYENVQELQDLNIISEDTIIYKAELQRSSALLSVLVAIPPEYPNQTPVFLLKLYWKGCHTAVSNFSLKELEEEVNVHFIEILPQQFKDKLLVCQMYHLAVCFDVFLETEYSGESFEGPHEFVKEKVFVKCARGPSRSRPYKYLSQGIFAYR